MSTPTSDPKEKHCAVCGRRMEWRRKWARNWDQVRYCSTACRRRKVRPMDRDLESAILSLLSDGAAGATICPSEAARRCVPDGWRELMERAREAGRRLAVRHVVEFRQDGRVVDPSTAKGPVRLGRGRRFSCEPGRAG